MNEHCTTGSFNVDNCTYDWFFNRRWQDYPYCPPTTWFTTSKVIDPTKQAFNIAKKLISEKKMRCDSVEEFIKIIDLIAEEL